MNKGPILNSFRVKEIVAKKTYKSCEIFKQSTKYVNHHYFLQ